MAAHVRCVHTWSFSSSPQVSDICFGWRRSTFSTWSIVCCTVHFLARQAHHQDGTACRTYSFVSRAGVGLFPLPVAQRERIGAEVVLAIKCIGCVLFRGWLFVHWAGHRNCVASAFTRTSRVFPTRVFSKMHKMSSVALPACCLPRNNPFSSILGTFS